MPWGHYSETSSSSSRIIGVVIGTISGSGGDSTFHIYLPCALAISDGGMPWDHYSGTSSSSSRIIGVVLGTISYSGWDGTLHTRLPCTGHRTCVVDVPSAISQLLLDTATRLRSAEDRPSISIGIRAAISSAFGLGGSKRLSSPPSQPSVRHTSMDSRSERRHTDHNHVAIRSC